LRGPIWALHLLGYPERRGLFEEYNAGVDWTSPIDLRKIINAYEQVLNRTQEFQSDPYYEKELKKLTALLLRDGYVFEGTRLIPLDGIDFKAPKLPCRGSTSRDTFGVSNRMPMLILHKRSRLPKNW
jgi:hypothetical protein